VQHAHERTALLGLAFHPRVISREEEIESDRRAVWADEEVDETEFNRREKADERTANAKRDRIHRRKHAMGLVFAGDLEKVSPPGVSVCVVCVICVHSCVHADCEHVWQIRTIILEMTKELIASYERIHCETDYDGLLLRDRASLSEEEERFYDDLVKMAKEVPSTSKLVESYIGLFGYAKALSPNLKDRNAVHLMQIREVRLASLLVQLMKSDEGQFHIIMNRMRAFEKILTRRLKARKAADLDRKGQTLEKSHRKGTKNSDALDLIRAKRLKTAQDWTHLSTAEAWNAAARLRAASPAWGAT